VRCSRVALWIWYRGEYFRGFQTQRDGPTVQQSLEHAMGVGSLVAAGRTDKGVHARMQVISVRQGDLPPEALLERLRALAPSGLGVCSAQWAPRSFHPHWSATGKEYRYRLRLGNGPSRWDPYSWSPSEDPRLAPLRIDPDRLALLLGRCVGTRDFAAFHESSSPRRLRSITHACLVELGGGLFEARILGDRFGRYQMRYLTGSAVAVCAGQIVEDDFRAALEQGATIRGIKAPARGLILWEVSYPGNRDPFGALERNDPEALPHDPPFACEQP